MTVVLDQEPTVVEIAHLNAQTLRNLIAGSLVRRAAKILAVQDDPKTAPAVKAEQLAAEILRLAEFAARSHIVVRNFARRHQGIGDVDGT